MIEESTFRTYLDYEKTESKVSQEHTFIWSGVVVKCPYTPLQPLRCLVRVLHLKCGHQMIHEAATEVLSFFSLENLVLRNWCAHRPGRDRVCVWWRTKNKLKDSWSFNEICKGRLHQFSAAWDNINQTPVCLRISWSLRPYKQTYYKTVLFCN